MRPVDAQPSHPGCLRDRAKGLLAASLVAGILALLGGIGCLIAYIAAGITAGMRNPLIFTLGPAGFTAFPGWERWQVVLLWASLGAVAAAGVLGFLQGRRMKKLLNAARTGQRR